MSSVSVCFMYGRGMSTWDSFFHFPNTRNLQLSDSGSRCNFVPDAFSNSFVDASTIINYSLLVMEGFKSSQKAIRINLSSNGGSTGGSPESTGPKTGSEATGIPQSLDSR